MKLFDLAAIEAALVETDVIAAIERAFVALGAGRAQLGAVGHLTFTDPPGECHVKSGHIAGEPVFVAKVATGFFDNPRIGLSSGQGFMAVMSARTGEALGLLADEGHLTDLRTALTGVVAARAIGVSSRTVLGIVGTGNQAWLQAEKLSRHLGIRDILIWGRDGDRADRLAKDVGGRAVDLQTLCAEAGLIVTATPATEPLLRDAWIRPGTRIIAVGSDGQGKRELDAAILARAEVIVDSVAQCIADGETGWAVRAGLLAPDRPIELGHLLAAPRRFAEDAVVVVDLTGVAVQDLAIAATVWQRLAPEPTSNG
jgi:ornithine cyclodeaminase/alanine dehydrogenase-like protein (mu-crystallin family)